MLQPIDTLQFSLTFSRYLQQISHLKNGHYDCRSLINQNKVLQRYNLCKDIYQINFSVQNKTFTVFLLTRRTLLELIYFLFYANVLMINLMFI